MAAAGPQGAQSHAHGTKGTKTGSSFKSDEQRAYDSWGVSNHGGHASAWGSKGTSDQQVKSNVHGQSFGNGGSGTHTGRDGAQAYAQGDKGTKTGADWKGSSNNKEDSWAVNQYGKNKY